MMSKSIRIACQGASVLSLDELTVFQGDLKDLSKENYEKLKQEVLDLGFSEPVSVWRTTRKTFSGDAEGEEPVNYLLNGTQRTRTLLAMRDEGYEIPPIPVNFVEADSEKQAKLKVLSLTSQFGEITKDGLYEFMSTSDISFEEVSASFRFPEIDLEDFKLDYFSDNTVAPGCDEDEVPEVVEPKAKPGDIYQLGNHRLMCGDSTNIQHVEALMNGEIVAMVFTDPPYRHHVDDTGTSTGFAKRRTFQSMCGFSQLNDFDPAGLFSTLSVLSVPTIYVFSSKGLLKDYIEFFDSVERSWELLVMNKVNPVPMKNNKFLGDIEWLFFSRGAGATFNGDEPYEHYFKCRMVTCKAPEYGHPTEKQVGFIEPLIKISSKPGSTVLDLFGGSGSTLIACEKTNRKCFMLEIDPHYIDVIIARWEKFSGKKAELINSPASLTQPEQT